ncbi:MAG: NfeD family protein [Elusimicrobiales bacterium]|nr:NfeD family protein [Elusimicrobiales bacterium]
MPEIDVNYWFWLSLGLILVIIEMILPGVFFLWFGIGAFATGIIAFLIKGIAIKYLMAIFGILSLISVFLGRRIIKPSVEQKNGLNDGNSKYAGKIVKAESSFENGSGRVIMGDTVWEAECPDPVKEGDPLKVTALKDAVLIVERANTK